MTRLKILVVDDSSLTRAVIRELLENADDIEVIGEAGNGREAVRLAAELRPDLITMDIEMPVMDGLQAIEAIMSTRAVPILVVSGYNDARVAFGAIARGALDIVSKRDLTPETARHFVDTVKRLARIPVVTRTGSRWPSPPPPLGHLPRPAMPSPPPPGVRIPPDAARASGPVQIFAIASSTGGPQALAAILARLPAKFPYPLVIAQHIADGFSKGMAEWLDGLCPLPVCLAREGETLAPGHAYLSPSETHLRVTREHRLALVARDPKDIYRPSCNHLLISVAEVYGNRSAGIILTGMGNDGAQGMERIFQAGGSTLAQDEASSVVFGMNKVAIDLGCVRKVLPVTDIAQEMCRLAGIVAV
ncbi:MAG: chemotaxis-specific protein-glutamate methyltransferase CheB [Pseudomonadota bacterium]